MTDAALALAVLRATRAQKLEPQDLSAARSVAPRLGRRVVEVGDGVTLGWGDGDEPQPDGTYSVYSLSRVPLVTFACCLTLCWRDRHAHPYPGRTTTRKAVLSLARALDLDDKHFKGALLHDLPGAGLVEISGNTVRLGVAIAVWPNAQIEALRRLRDRLPAPTEDTR